MLLANALPDWMQPVDVQVKPALDDFQPPLEQGVLWQAAKDKLLLDIPHFGRVIASRDEIHVSPEAARQWVCFGPFLRATPLAATVLLRGGFCCNAAALAGPDGAILLMGETAAGKSALALALMKRGLKLMADDAAPVFPGEDGKALAFPVWPQMHLWPDTVETILASGHPGRLLQPASQLADNAPYHDIAEQAFASHPVPLRAIYVIQGNRRLRHVCFRPGPHGIERLSSSALLPYHRRIAAALTTPANLLRIYAAIDGTDIQYIDMPQRGLAEIEYAADEILQECRWPTLI